MESVISWARQYNPKLERWSFTTGFVTLGIVHVTQYLAIVWRYNRSLATKSASVREGWFKNWFSSNGAVAITAYIGFCLLYGYIVTMGPASSVQPGVYSPDYDIAPMLAEGLKWAAGVLAAILFTSTIIHYYYDGFIWKVRHKENQRNLEMGGNDDNDSSRSKSWWNKDETLGPGAAISLQALYFVPPMLVLIVFYWVNRPAQSYPLRDTKNAIVQLRDAKTNDQKQTARQLTEEALHGLEIQLGIERDILELSKSGSHLTYAADLTYWQSKAKYVMAIADDQSVKEAAVAHISAIDETIDLYEQALTRRGILIHDEDDSKTRQSIYDSIDVLKKERESIQQNTIRL